MVSDKRGGPQAGSDAVPGTRPVVTRPGSVNRGFASVDPERQRETVAEGGDAANERGKAPQDRANRAPASRAPAPPLRARRGREEADTGEEGGSG